MSLYPQANGPRILILYSNKHPLYISKYSLFFNHHIYLLTNSLSQVTLKNLPFFRSSKRFTIEPRAQPCWFWKLIRTSNSSVLCILHRRNPRVFSPLLCFQWVPTMIYNKSFFFSLRFNESLRPLYVKSWIFHLKFWYLKINLMFIY